MNDLTGAGSETTNSLTGSVVRTDGSGNAIIVRLLPSGFDCVKQAAGTTVKLDTTDAYGKYTFTGMDTGLYTIEAQGLSDGNRALSFGTFVAGHILKPADTLRAPGKISVPCPEGLDLVSGYFYIPGTTIAVPIAGQGDTVVLDSVAPGVIPSVMYAAKRADATAPKAIRDNVVVESLKSTVLAYSGFQYSKKLYLNTTAQGAGVSGNVTKFPVLVRLATGNFNFGQAKKDGSDIRFANNKGMPLSFEIEKWDSAAALAAVWVKVDTVFGNNATQYISLYWGAMPGWAVASSSDGAAVFDTAEGFAGVWHMGQPGNGAALDATANHYNGTPFNMSTASAVTGMIGGAQRFDGKSSYLEMNGTATGKLDFPVNGTFAISAWAYADSLDQYFHVIVCKGDKQYNLETTPRGNWEIADYKDGAGWDVSKSPARQKVWTFITGIRNGSKQYLYVDGELADTGLSLEASNAARNTMSNLLIGRTRDPLSDTTGYYYNGVIDEVRICTIAPSADWIKLCFMNQKAVDQLVFINE